MYALKKQPVDDERALRLEYLEIRTITDRGDMRRILSIRDQGYA